MFIELDEKHFIYSCVIPKSNCTQAIQSLVNLNHLCIVSKTLDNSWVSVIKMVWFEKGNGYFTMKVLFQMRYLGWGNALFRI